ncbi:MAG: beta-glucuronidase [Clostridia bacterium]|nr:beta-glucuronidase [Clostridia bacterium]
MLYPQVNAARLVQDLGGVWDFRLRETDAWQSIAVPASYNDQKADPAFRMHCGVAAYRRRFTVPRAMAGQRRVLRFDAVTHDARVYLNDALLCTHKGGFLPFEAEITALVEPGEEAELVVEVDNRINHGTLPVGNEGGTAFFGSDNPGIPSVEAGKRRQGEINLPNFDFFNYAGINRPVRLYTTPMDYIDAVTLIPDVDGEDGWVRYAVKTVGEGQVRLTVLDAQGEVVASAEGAEGQIRVPRAHLWQPWPGEPYLYTAQISFAQDAYAQTFGIRTVAVSGEKFLINGRPFYLKGPCKHEDAPFHGRGLDICLQVKDIGLFHWLGANAVRTSHYPYAEEFYDLCDREGIVVIDETPAVGIGAGERQNPYETFPLAAYHAQVLEEMIGRDQNHPSVVMWSLGNEPDTEHFPQAAYDYWRPLYDLAHRLDPQGRPVTLVCCQNDYTKDLITRTMDVVCINRYYGWYNLSGDLEAAKYAFDLELEFWQGIGKPLILSEYGADTLPGLHSAVPVMFTEEFQAAYYEAINSCLDRRSFVVGELPWNFADFEAQPGPMRPGGNRKGLFTRDRQPKLAAHYFRSRWKNR